MLPRLTACCRTVPRQLLAPHDSVWVSDDLLLLAFQQFYRVSRTARRHGSFVPGPMEGRRRLGRRRMAYASESITPATWGPGMIWPSPFGAGETQLQWEPPTERPSLPAWLTEWTPKDSETALDSNAAAIQDAPEEKRGIEADIQEFRKALKCPSLSICADFNHKFRQDLTLGLVDSNALAMALEVVTKALRKVFKDEILTEQYFAFYKAVGDGISACKVFQPTDFDAKVIGHLVSLIAQLPSTTEVQTLACSILHSISVKQLQSILEPLKCLVESWSRSWLEKPPVADLGDHLAMAESKAGASQQSLLNAHELTLRASISIAHLARAREALRGASNDIRTSIEAISTALPYMSSPFKSSVEALSSILERIPKKSLSRFLLSCTERILTSVISDRNYPYELRHVARLSWLSVAIGFQQGPKAPFYRIWTTVESHRFAHPSANTRWMLSDREISNLLLDHWISRGLVKDEITCKKTFAVESFYQSDNEGFIPLLRAIKTHANTFDRGEDLLRLLYGLKKHEKTLDALKDMSKLDIKIGMRRMALAVDAAVINLGPMKAYMTHEFAQRIVYSGTMFLELKEAATFILALVNSEDFRPDTIWSLLGMKTRHSLPDGKMPPLSQAKINLVSEMACAFSRRKDHSERMVLRNVMHCAFYLRSHGVPDSPQIVRAIGYATIIRPVVNGKGPVTERLKWALGLIREIEGDDVADKVDRTVFAWKEHKYQKRAAEKDDVYRRGNVLRVGPID